MITDLLKRDMGSTGSADWERTKRVYNILADRVETVVPFLADGILRNDRAGAKVAWLTGGIVMGVSLDMTGKWLLADYTLAQFVLLRSLFGAAMLMLLAHGFGGLKSLKTRRPGWHLLRTLLAAGAMFGFFWGLSHMKLVDALTLSFTAPLMTTALSALFSFSESVLYPTYAAAPRLGTASALEELPRRAEAGKLLALGQAQVAEDPTAALAYAKASLALADTPAKTRSATQ